MAVPVKQQVKGLEHLLASYFVTAREKYSEGKEADARMALHMAIGATVAAQKVLTPAWYAKVQRTYNQLRAGSTAFQALMG